LDVVKVGETTVSSNRFILKVIIRSHVDFQNE
jgi:hypothetical protein